MTRYCAYQDRCRSEVFKKLEGFDLKAEECEWIVEQLEMEKYLDEDRYARSYVRGRFGTRKWGKLKIGQHLKAKGVDSQLINQAVNEEIDEDAYEEALEGLLAKKMQSEKEQDPYKRKAKIINHLLTKGYESDLIFPLVSQALNS